MPTNPLDALRRLSVQPYRPEMDSSQSDPNAQRYVLDNQFKDETEGRILSNQRAAAASFGMSDPRDAIRNVQSYSGEANALSHLLGAQQRDIAENPISAGIDEANDYHQKERQAILGGFTGGTNPHGEGMNPIQQAAEYGRQFETAKLQVPIEAQRVAGEADIEKQRVASRGNIDVANSKAAQQEAALNAAFASGKPIRSMNPSTGAFSFEIPRPPVQVNPQLLRDVTTTRANLKAKGAHNSFFGIPYGESPESVAYKGAVGAAFAQHPAGPDAKGLAQMIAEDDSLDHLSTDEAIQHLQSIGAVDASDMTPEERNEVDELLYIARGMTDTTQPQSARPPMSIHTGN